MQNHPGRLPRRRKCCRMFPTLLSPVLFFFFYNFMAKKSKGRGSVITRRGRKIPPPSMFSGRKGQDSRVEQLLATSLVWQGGQSLFDAPSQSTGKVLAFWDQTRLQALLYKLTESTSFSCMNSLNPGEVLALLRGWLPHEAESILAISVYPEINRLSAKNSLEIPTLSISL